MGNSLEFVRNRIRRVAGVESAELTKIGTIAVILSEHNHPLREEVLDFGRRALVPVQVFFRMPDGRVVGEEQDPVRESIEDWYTPIKVPGFAGEPASTPAPADEISKDPKGALKLKRVRAATRGRPVVAWKLGNEEVRAGTYITFAKDTPLQWTMGRTMNVQAGTTAHVAELSSRRPIAFIVVGEHDGVELPIHMLGHAFHVASKKVESLDLEEAKKPKKAAKDSEMTPEFNRIMNTLNFASGWGRDPEKDRVAINDPYYRDGWMTRDVTSIDDDIDHSKYEEFEEDVDECDMVNIPDAGDPKIVRRGKPLMTDRKKR